jgi:LPS-assembly lipoprotein
MRWIVFSGTALVALLLAGCGFQLRGQASLPPAMSVTYVQSQTGIGTPPGVLSRRLQQALRSSGVTVTQDPGQATATLTILGEGSGRRIRAADRFDVKRAYSLAYNAAFQVTLADGQVLVPPESISANRSLLFDENRILGFEAALESLEDNMADDLAWQIIRRLQAIPL